MPCVLIFVALVLIAASTANLNHTTHAQHRSNHSSLFQFGGGLMHHGSNISHPHSKRAHKNPMKQGVVGLIPKISLHGAIIMSDRGTDNPNDTPEQTEKKQRLISARLHSVHKLMSELPFPLSEWAAVFTDPCPLYPGGHKTERGLIWAHYRIFREFAYFDPVVLSQIPNYVQGQKVNELNHSISSSDGVYVAYQNGSLYKNGIPFLDEDIITIFEDDAESAINGLNTTILEEFSQMNTDLLFLGWCDGRMARPVPLCAHAYAVTRRGARKLTQFLEPCGRALDEQFVIFGKNNFITWRKAFGHSYKDLNEKYKNLYGEKTYGIFHQNKALGSINGH